MYADGLSLSKYVSTDNEEASKDALSVQIFARVQSESTTHVSPGYARQFLAYPSSPVTLKGGLKVVSKPVA